MRLILDFKLIRPQKQNLYNCREKMDNIKRKIIKAYAKIVLGRGNFELIYTTQSQFRFPGKYYTL